MRKLEMRVVGIGVSIDKDGSSQRIEAKCVNDHKTILTYVLSPPKTFDDGCKRSLSHSGC